jgi:hypothetical protein
MVSASVSERKLLCEGISDILRSGAVDRAELLRMAKNLVSLLHEMTWEVRGHLNGRNDSPEMQQADRWLVSGKNTLAWAEAHAPFALTFELARCVEIANGAALRVVERLQLQGEGAAA